MIENRRSYRLPFRSKFVFSHAGRVYCGNPKNLSSGGVFVAFFEAANIPRESLCECLFSTSNVDRPIRVQAIVKRVVALDPNPEIVPGLAFNFVEESSPMDLARLRDYMAECRQNFETAATLLMSGEPDIGTLGPLVQSMNLPPQADLGELRREIERTVRAMELVDENNARTNPGGTPPSSGGSITFI